MSPSPAFEFDAGAFVADAFDGGASTTQPQSSSAVASGSPSRSLPSHIQQPPFYEDRPLADIMPTRCDDLIFWKPLVLNAPPMLFFVQNKEKHKFVSNFYGQLDSKSV